MSNSSNCSVGIKHNSERTSHGFGRKIFSELGSHKSIVSMSSSDCAPHDSEFCIVFCVFGFKNVSDSLSEVVGSCDLVIHSLDLEQSKVLTLSSFASSEANKDGLGVKSKNQN